MERNLSEGWKRIGCSVENFFYGTHMGKDWSSKGLAQNHQINSKIIDKAKSLQREGKLDLIFAVIYDDVLSVDTVQKLRNLNVPLVNYHVDLVGQWYRILRTGKYFDLVACAQRDNWAGLYRAGIRPYYMPMASNPPIEIDKGKIPFEGVLYLGSPWHFRQQVLVELANNDFPLKVYGHNWLRRTSDPANAQPWRKNIHDIRYYLHPRLRQEGLHDIKEMLGRRLKVASQTSQNNQFQVPTQVIHGAYSDADFTSLVRGAAINLGFTHFYGAPGTPLERRQVRLREFEIPMNGGFYLAQDCSQLRELFPEGGTVATWNHTDDLYEKVHYYLQNSVERRQIAQTAQAYCLQHHTWANRFRNLLKKLCISDPVLTEQ